MARFTRNRGSKIMRFRSGNGRFGRATIENVFGLKSPICSKCRGFNPHGIDEPRPENCHHCGEILIDLAEASRGNE